MYSYLVPEAASARQGHVVTAVYVQKHGKKDFLIQERAAEYEKNLI